MPGMAPASEKDEGSPRVVISRLNHTAFVLPGVTCAVLFGILVGTVEKARHQPDASARNATIRVRTPIGTIRVKWVPISA